MEILQTTQILSHIAITRRAGTLRRVVGLGILAGALFTAAAQPAGPMYFDGPSPERIEFAIDVAEDMAKFVEPRVPVGTEPLRGSFFITEGNIYRAGTIPRNGAEFDPNMPGSIGTWFCKGTFLVRGSEFDKAAMAVLSDQVFLLSNDKRSIATTAGELCQWGTAMNRIWPNATAAAAMVAVWPWATPAQIGSERAISRHLRG